MMCGMLGAAGLGQMFALVVWALLIALIVALVSWTVNRLLSH
jgi:hypothetical protein